MNDFSSSQSSNDVYTSGDYILLWGMQALVSQGAPYSYDYGIAAVQDNYGDEFYYDSCILIFNHPPISSSSSTVALPAELMGDVAYGYTYSGEFDPGLGALNYLIGGFDMYTSHEAVGAPLVLPPGTILPSYTFNAYVADGSNGYEPAPTSSAGSYSIDITLFPEPSITITYTPPSSTGPSISVSTTPYYENEAGYFAYNLTWTFDYVWSSMSSFNNEVIVNGFQVGPGWGAAIFLKNYSPGNTYWFYLPFNAEVETLCWNAWANMVWEVSLTPSSSNTVSINSAYFGYPPFQPPSNVPSGSWISGYSIQCINGNVSLSGPS
jgi:hypothetical protein